MKITLICVICVICGSASALSAAQDWPAFRGPGGQGHAAVDGFNLVAMRGEINPKNSWASPTPIVEGDRVNAHD